MNRYALSSLVVLLLLFPACFGQQSTGESLVKLFSEIRTTRDGEARLKINDSVKLLIGRYAESDSVFSHRFTELRYVGQITSPDSLVKMLTWNLIAGNGDTRYYCYFVKREKKTGGGKVCFIEGKHTEGKIRTDTVYSAANWYGALYYDLRPFEKDGSISYLVLGLDNGNAFISRKVIEVITFGKDCTLTFGLNCITDGKTIVPRVVFEYSSSAVMSVKFEADNLVVFDHLSPFSPEYTGNRQYYGPDFSFDSFTFDKGYWRLKSDIDIKNRDSR